MQMSNELNRLIDYLEDLKSEEVKRRLVAVKHLADIAKAFGSERTRKELLPFLKEYEDDEEEILIELSGQMYLISKIVGDKDGVLTDLIGYFSIVLNYEDYSVINEVL